MISYRLFSLLIFCFFTCSESRAGYTLADLEVLSLEKNYKEFFAHALDVRPSERQEKWKEMVSQMADGNARQILSSSVVQKENFVSIETLFSWPALKSDDLFKAHRQEIGLRFLTKCLKDEAPCWGELQAFWEVDKKDPDVAFKLAKLTTNLTESPIKTWTFLDVALKSPLSEFYCKEEFVLTSVWEKLEIDYIRLGPQGNFLKKIDQTVHPDCLISLNLWAKKLLYKPNKVLDRELAYQILDTQGKGEETIKDFFYTVYLLENPSKGELFNYAWNRLTDLGKSVKRRDEVIKKIKTLDPLPDSLFSSLDEAKKNAILAQFKTKFPEYLNYYTDQCLLFYGGKKSFPQGNPTIKCQNLMESDVAIDLLGKETVDSFHQVRSL
jgi:hypothetical protein